MLDKARKKREEMEKLAGGKQVVLNAIELSEAIEKKDIMKAFAKMDEQTTNCPHPETGRSAVHCCVEHNSKEMLQMVIEAKADLNLKDNFGQTPLMVAAKQGNNEISKALLEAGADATEEDVLGRSAGDMVKVLPPTPDHPSKNWREKMAGAPIPEDPAKKSQDLKNMIIEKEKPKKYGQMLINAINQKDVRTAESSLEAGGDPNYLDERGDSPLLLLAKGKWRDQEGLQCRLFDKAVKAGANINFQNPGGNTPLLYAAHRGNLQMLEALLQARADVTVTNNEGNTALMYAAHGGYEAACNALLEAYAAPAAKNSFGLTAEQMAQKRGFRSCAVLIQAYEMAPKRPEDDTKEKLQEKEKKTNLSFDYSKWNLLEKAMVEEEEEEQNTKQREAMDSVKKPPPKLEDMGPEAFGLPADTPWPPADPSAKRKGPFDYSRWDKVVDDIERHEKVQERYEHLQQNPQYEYKNGTKMRVIF